MLQRDWAAKSAHSLPSRNYATHARQNTPIHARGDKVVAYFDAPPVRQSRPEPVLTQRLTLSTHLTV